MPGYLYTLNGIDPVLCTRPNLTQRMQGARQATHVVGTLKEVAIDNDNGRAVILFGSNVDEVQRDKYIEKLGVRKKPHLTVVSKT